jgi:hypothetical protein
LLDQILSRKVCQEEETVPGQYLEDYLAEFLSARMKSLEI